MVLYNKWVTEEIKEEIKKIPAYKWQWRHNDSKSMTGSKRSSKREFYSNTSLSQESRKIST